VLLTGAVLEGAAAVTAEKGPNPDHAHLGQRASIDITIEGNEIFPHFRKTPKIENSEAPNGPNVFTSGDIKGINGVSLSLDSGETIVVTNPTTVTQVDENYNKVTWEVFKVNTDSGIQNAYVRMDNVDLENMPDQKPSLQSLTPNDWEDLPAGVNSTTIIPPQHE
jgi:hypothetical protein